MKGTILTVDDERTQREILRSILASEGYRTLLAGSGQEALDALERENVDLVLTDLVMPGTTGGDLIAPILAKTPGTPIRRDRGPRPPRRECRRVRPWAAPSPPIVLPPGKTGHGRSVLAPNFP